MELLLIVLIILFVLGLAGGFAFHLLWILAVVCLVIFLIRLGTRGRTP